MDDPLFKDDIIPSLITYIAPCLKTLNSNVNQWRIQEGDPNALDTTNILTFSSFLLPQNSPIR